MVFVSPLHQASGLFASGFSDNISANFEALFQEIQGQRQLGANQIPFLPDIIF